jgi:hypothetical protein
MASVDVRRKEAAATMRRKLPLDLAETEPGHPQLLPNARQDSVQPTVEHVPDLFKACARKGGGEDFAFRTKSSHMGSFGTPHQMLKQSSRPNVCVRI